MEATYPVILVAVVVSVLLQVLKKLWPGCDSTLAKRVLVVLLSGGAALALSAARGDWPPAVEVWTAEAVGIIAVTELAYRWLMEYILPVEKI